MIKGAEGESDKYTKQSIAEEAVDQLQASEKLIAGEWTSIWLLIKPCLDLDSVNGTNVC